MVKEAKCNWHIKTLTGLALLLDRWLWLNYDSTLGSCKSTQPHETAQIQNKISKTLTVTSKTKLHAGKKGAEQNFDSGRPPDEQTGPARKRDWILDFIKKKINQWNITGLGLFGKSFCWQKVETFLVWDFVSFMREKKDQNQTINAGDKCYTCCFVLYFYVHLLHW